MRRANKFFKPGSIQPSSPDDGTQHFTNPVCEVDARPGGALNAIMRSPDGADYSMTGKFQAVIKPERIAF